jgi:hypothetical protein
MPSRVLTAQYHYQVFRSLIHCIYGFLSLLIPGALVLNRPLTATKAAMTRAASAPAFRRIAILPPPCLADQTKRILLWGGGVVIAFALASAGPISSNGLPPHFSPLFSTFLHSLRRN